MEVKSDIEIAQEAVMENIASVAAKVGISSDDLEMYGKYKAKISDDVFKKLENQKDGKLILVTAINPTPADAKVTFTIDDYTFEGDGLKELYVPINRNFTYTVSKQGYQTITETISISEDSIIPVTLKELAEKPQLNVEDYEYTSDNNDNITLTKYIGTRVDVIATELTTQ